MERLRMLSRRPTGRAGALALIAIFWIAQLHGIQHSISHLSALSSLGDRSAPHALVCADCLAAAESGAAPLPATLIVTATVSPTLHAPLGAVVVVDRLFAAAYRSRAPPTAPI